MVQLPSAPSDSGNSRSTSAARCCAICSTTPASQVMVLEAVSISRILSRRRSETTTSPLMRRLAADEAGVAALRHERDAVLVGKLADRGDFRRRARPQHQRRAAAKQVALLGGVGRDVGGIGHRIFVADDGAEFARSVPAAAAALLAGRYSLLRSRPRQSLSTAARRSRSLIASPSPSSGIGITAMVLRGSSHREREDSRKDWRRLHRDRRWQRDS